MVEPGGMGAADHLSGRGQTRPSGLGGVGVGGEECAQVVAGPEPFGDQVGAIAEPARVHERGEDARAGHAGRPQPLAHRELDKGARRAVEVAIPKKPHPASPPRVPYRHRPVAEDRPAY